MPLASTGKWDSKAGYSYIWISGIHPYIANCAWDGGGRNTSKVIFCPADDKEIFLYNGNKKISNYAYAGKLGNMSIADDNYKPRTLAKCLSTSTCAVIIDGKCQSRSSALFDIVNPASAGNYLAPRHADGLSVLYADNHVAWFNTKSASQAQIDTIFRWNTYKDWPY
jgi:prepilin-type processing-associated H-X9-DG protein